MKNPFIEFFNTMFFADADLSLKEDDGGQKQAEHVVRALEYDKTALDYERIFNTG